MALIEYRIDIDASGNATVCQDVVDINVPDQIQFVVGKDQSGKGKPTAIKFDKGSPFSRPAVGDVVQVPARKPGPPDPLTIGGASVKQPLAVIKSAAGGTQHFVLGRCKDINESRKSFSFQCGFLNPAFTLWAGGGGDCPSGGTP